MKGVKFICLDSELIEKLKEINASGLINELLTDYFNKFNPKKTIDTKPLEQKRQDLDNQIKEMEKELEKRKIIDNLPLDPLIKAWFSKLPEKPSLAKLISFLDANALPRKDCIKLLNYYDIFRGYTQI